ncbi:MAG: hypothetical protein ACXW3M_05210, partial [Rhodoplanes sp.]
SARGCYQLAPQRTFTSNPVPMPGTPSPAPTARRCAAAGLDRSRAPSTTGTYSVYVDDKDRVWATDWPANAIQRFDPRTETFETFASDKKGANVRQMLGRPGEAWAAESGTNRLAVVRD